MAASRTESPVSVSRLLASSRRQVCRYSTGETRYSSRNTRVEWIKKTWDFGNITQGETVTHTFYFKNTGTQNLLIKNVETGCGCTTADYDKAPVRPGKEGKIEIAFNSEGRYGKQYKEIRIFANIPEKQVILSFTATVKELNQIILN